MKNYLDNIAILLLVIFFSCLAYAGYLSYKSIDFQVLEKLEKQPLVLPTPEATSITVPSAKPSIEP